MTIDWANMRIAFLDVLGDIDNGHNINDDDMKYIIEAAVGDTVLYEVKDISTRDAFVNGGMLSIDAVNGKHQGVLVQVYPEVKA